MKILLQTTALVVALSISTFVLLNMAAVVVFIHDVAAARADQQLAE